MQRYTPPVNDEERFLQRRIADLIKSAANTGKARTSGFLNEREQQLALMQLGRDKWDSYLFEGGHEEAERRMLCIYTGQPPTQFPFTMIKISLSGMAQAKKLTHRDYLGALLALGLQRDCIGDIMTDDDSAVVWVQESIVPFLQDELTRVGRESVEIEVCTAEEALPEQEAPQQKRASVSSLRVDGVLAAMLQCSRTKAAALVQKGLVQVNHLQIEALHYTVAEGDTFSVKGKGKFRLHAVGGISRKKRITIEFMKF